MKNLQIHWRNDRRIDELKNYIVTWGNQSQACHQFMDIPLVEAQQSEGHHVKRWTYCSHWNLCLSRSYELDDVLSRKALHFTKSSVWSSWTDRNFQGPRQSSFNIRFTLAGDSWYCNFALWCSWFTRKRSKNFVLFLNTPDPPSVVVFEQMAVFLSFSSRNIRRTFSKVIECVTIVVISTFVTSLHSISDRKCMKLTPFINSVHTLRIQSDTFLARTTHAVT